MNSLFEYDLSLLKSSKNNYLFIGIDEVGRGALAGPVISCAFTWKERITKKHISIFKELNDSKKISKEKREKLEKLLKENGFYGIGWASILEIEKLNILNATFLAMKRAYENLTRTLEKNNAKNKDCYLLIDGNKFNPYIDCIQNFIIDGDAKSSLIASASIIAKVYRDKLMTRLTKEKKFKPYNFQKNVGYGTLEHRKSILKNGPCALHRKLFLRKVLTNSI